MRLPWAGIGVSEPAECPLPRQGPATGTDQPAAMLLCRWKIFDVKIAGAAEIDGPPPGQRHQVADAPRGNDRLAELPVAHAPRLDRLDCSSDAGRAKRWCRIAGDSIARHDERGSELPDGVLVDPVDE